MVDYYNLLADYYNLLVDYYNLLVDYYFWKWENFTDQRWNQMKSDEIRWDEMRWAGQSPFGPGPSHLWYCKFVILDYYRITDRGTGSEYSILNIFKLSSTNYY